MHSNNSIFISDSKKSYPMKDMGLVFIRNIDPINKIILKLHNLKYTSIGFYYKSTIHGSPKYKIILIDIFGIRSSQYTFSSLDDLLKCPLIDLIEYKSLKAEYLYNDFKTSLIEFISNIKCQDNKNDIKDGLKRLFGLISLYDNKSSIGIMNTIINNILSSFDGKIFDESIYLRKDDLYNEESNNSQDDIEKINYDIFSKVEFISLLGSIFNPIKDKDMLSFKTDCTDYNTIFDDINTLDINEYRQNINIDISIGLKESLFSIKDELILLISEFINLIITDQIFYECIIHHFNNKININKQIQEEYLNIISILSNTNKNSLLLIKKWFNGDDINHNEFIELEKDINKNLCILTDKFGYDKHEYINLSECFNPKDDIIRNHVLSLRNQISNISKDICIDNSDEIDYAYININKMIEDINIIYNKYYLTDEPINKIEGEYSTSAIITVTSKEEVKIPLKMKSGKKIVLTTLTQDLSMFEYDELLEILEVLDILIVDEKYDTLRSNITLALAEFKDKLK